MGAFSLITGPDVTRREILERRQFEAMRAQGFVNPQRLELTDGVLFLYSKQISPATNFLTFKNGDFVAACGTFCYKGCKGKEALAEIFEDCAPAFSCEKTANFEPLPAPMHGTFACFVSKRGKLLVFTDRIGYYKVYYADSGIFSSSFLATVACIDSPQLCMQSSLEYVFQGATYRSTVIENVSLLDPECAIRVSNGTVGLQRRQPLRQLVRNEMSLPDHIEQIGNELDRVFDDHVSAFREGIDAALSGGYDSRLILAHLLARGIKPGLHVYGSEQDDDVRVAKIIAHGERLSLQHIDKKSCQGMNRCGDPAEMVERNFQAFDGLPPDGIFDSGADLATREDRARNGKLSLNGGGGEIFRNFFYLPDRPFQVRDIVWSFYSQFDPACFAKGIDSRDYQERLAEKIRETLGVSSTYLDRLQVERVYPEFRCRYWMGRNSSINNRLGYMHTPLVEPSLVELAGAVPIRYKNTGKLAAGLIRRIYPRLAAYDSSYRHSFSGPPPWSRVVKESATLYRPPFLRSLVFRLKARANRPARIKAMQTGHDLAAVVGADDLRTRGLLNHGRIFEPNQLRRLWTLEYFCKRSGASL